MVVQPSDFIKELSQTYEVSYASNMFILAYNDAWHKYKGFLRTCGCNKCNLYCIQNYIHSCVVPDEFWTDYDWNGLYTKIKNHEELTKYKAIPFYKRLFKKKPKITDVVIPTQPQHSQSMVCDATHRN